MVKKNEREKNKESGISIISNKSERKITKLKIDKNNREKKVGSIRSHIDEVQKKKRRNKIFRLDILT